MRDDLMKEISNPENRIQDAVEFFGWPRELVECMFKHSKQYFEGPWQRFFPGHEQHYYAAGLYTIRQLSYAQNDIFTEDVSNFLDQVNGSVLDFGCGVGDYAMYLAYRGFPVYVHEHYCIPERFLEFRFKKYGLDIKIIRAMDEMPIVDYTLLISCLDHLWDPVLFTRGICENTRKKIFATPCIDETYDRPTHIKEILKDVPKAFEVIKQFNNRDQSAAQ